MTRGEHQEAFSFDVALLLTESFRRGYKVRIGEAERPLEMQAIYYKSGRSKTMDSQHIKKLAVDLHFFKDGKICYPQEMGDYWEGLCSLNRWGGNWKSFKDGPHFERRA